MARPFYTVFLLTETGWTYSRSFQKVVTARKWAKWCSKSWPASIYKGGPEGECIATFAKAA